LRSVSGLHPRLFAGLFFCIILFLLLTAVLWLPLAEFVGHSPRTELTLKDTALFSLPPSYLIGLLVPNLGGFQEYMAYFGIAPLALACLGAVKGAGRDRVGTLTVIGLGIVSVWWSLGPSAGLFAVVSRLPLLSLLRVPSRAMFVFGLAVSWLAVRGAAAVEDGFRLRGRAWNLASVALLVALWILAVGGSIAAKKVLANFIITAVTVTGVLIGLRLKSATIILTAFAAVELLAVDSTLIAPQPVTRNPVAEWLSGQPGVWRVYSPSYSLPQLDAAQLSLEQADGVNPLQLAETVTYMEAATGIERHGYSVTVPAFEMQNDNELVDVTIANAGAFPDPELLGALNVRYVVSEFDIQVEGLELRAMISNTRVYENVRDAGRVRGGALTSWSPNRIVVTANGPGRVTLAEVWYPGWVATVDGAPAEFERDGIFRSVRVEGGGRKIVFEFRPVSFFVGVGSSFFGIILTLIVSRLRDDSNQTF
ncbi:MAG TPA: hypothetical protein VJ020_01170, partial [Anaerolineales bacterium]|nr:hypothetical protein [Anaerolineales bacterium]